MIIQSNAAVQMALRNASTTVGASPACGYEGGITLLIRTGVPLGLSLVMGWALHTTALAQDPPAEEPPEETSDNSDAEAISAIPTAAESAIEGGETAVDSATAEIEQLDNELSAADAPAATELTPPGDANTDVITVTGSRIKRKSIATAAPVSVIDIEDIQAVGRPSLAEVLQRLPSAANAINLQFNNGGNGAARINLRSLGTERTLVLVNGRRFVYGGDGADASVDLNAIPTSIIERVEVLKDGGSAVYGSDAIAGVVNIITRTDFDGVEANAYSSITQEGDGRIYQIDVTGGLASDDGRSNLIFSAQFLDQQPIFAGERSFSRNSRSFNFTNFGRDKAANNERSFGEYLSIGGSGTVPGGRIVDLTGAPGNAAWDAANCHLSVCQNGSAGAGDLGQGWRPSGDSDSYNFQPENYLSTPYQRLSFFTTGNYRVNDYLGFFFEGSFTRRESQQLLAATPFVTSSEGITVSADNRYNPFGRDFGLVQRRMLEAGNRVFSQEGITARAVVGMRGDLPVIGPIANWSWDAHLNYGRTDTTNIVEGRFNRPRLINALGPDSGCTGDCVPLDLFNGPGSITQEMIDYISFTGVDRGFNEQYVGSFNMGGPLFQLMAQDPVAVSIGYEFRREEGGDTPNPLTAAGDSTGNKRNVTSGFFEVNSVFAELSVPIVSNMVGAEQLELTAAVRYVDFNTFGDQTTYKFGLRWNPTEFLAVRGTFSTAFRAPSVIELFGGASDSFPNVSDPCSTVVGNLDNPIVAANCAAVGVEGGVLDDRVQIITREGGALSQPDGQGTLLEPETAEIYTFGLVLEDSLIKGLTASVDFYNIEIDNAMEQIGAGIILASCYTQAAGNQQYCDRVIRDGTGRIEVINDFEANVGGFVAQGIDFGIRYASPNFAFGRLGAGLEGTFLLDFAQIQGSGFKQSYKGNYDQASGSDPGANMDYRLNAFLRWAYKQFNAGTNFRYLPSFKECQGGVCEIQREEGEDPPVERTINDYFYMDLFAGMDISSPLGGTSLTVGINNVTNITPPFIANGFLAESDAATYDYAGRSYYIRLTQQF